ncbi:2-dehydro-3-deoxygluconokinase [Bacilli bacterium]|nr:2-dehydro-3-deoxygluconokinase [Bacilli bacterium]GHU40891.1 2-dehydro-3-deoxygluconokinase [Bacilli bacterium]GHU45181.1 2-dehydro-3-deoxygluconokinase [Bacilli bacterium]
MPEFITIGEPLVVFASDELDLPLTRAVHFKKFLAGAELNVAIGLSRLGYDTAYVAKVGQDSLGNFIRTELEKSGVGDTFITQVSDYPTGFYLKEKVSNGDPKVEYFRKESAATHFDLEQLTNVDLSQIKVAHLTGIMAAISENGLTAVRSLLTELAMTDTLTVFDPNLRPALWQSEEVMRETLNDLAKSAKIILPGISEGRVLTGLSRLSDIADFYLNQSEITQTVIIKNGSEGAYVKSKNGAIFTVEGYQVAHVVDTVGAGDGFAAGLISGLLDQETLRVSVQRACAIGAFAVQSVGDNNGYPNRQVLEAFMHSS